MSPREPAWRWENHTNTIHQVKPGGAALSCGAAGTERQLRDEWLLDGEFHLIQRALDLTLTTQTLNPESLSNLSWSLFSLTLVKFYYSIFCFYNENGSVVFPQSYFFQMYLFIQMQKWNSWTENNCTITTYECVFCNSSKWMVEYQFYLSVPLQSDLMPLKTYLGKALILSIQESRYVGGVTAMH